MFQIGRQTCASHKKLFIAIGVILVACIVVGVTVGVIYGRKTASTFYKKFNKIIIFGFLTGGTRKRVVGQQCRARHICISQQFIQLSSLP